MLQKAAKHISKATVLRVSLLTENICIDRAQGGMLNHFEAHDLVRLCFVGATKFKSHVQLSKMFFSIRYRHVFL